jgi:2-iminobutanoate/2-iminopropanoate deaminase
MRREIIEVPVISEAIRRLGSPTSAVARAGGLVFTCGMPPIDCVTGAIVGGGIREQTIACLDALDVTLRHAGSALDLTLKASVYVTDPAMMAIVNEVYRERFTQGFPARTAAGIKPWPLPFDIEIECLATLAGEA